METSITYRSSDGDMGDSAKEGFAKGPGVEVVHEEEDSKEGLLVLEILISILCARSESSLTG